MIYFIIFFSLKLPVQSVLITTEVVSSNPGRVEQYSIQHYVITFVSDLRQDGCVPVAIKSLIILQLLHCHLLFTSSEVYSIQHYVIKFLSDLQQVHGFLRFPPVINVTSTLYLKYCWKWHLTPTILTLFSLIDRYLCIYVNHTFDIFR